MFDPSLDDLSEIFERYLLTALFILDKAVLIIAETAEPNVSSFCIKSVIGAVVNESGNDISDRISPAIGEYSGSSSNVIIALEAVDDGE